MRHKFRLASWIVQSAKQEAAAWWSTQTVGTLRVAMAALAACEHWEPRLAFTVQALRYAPDETVRLLLLKRAIVIGSSCGGACSAFHCEATPPLMLMLCSGYERGVTCSDEHCALRCGNGSYEGASALDRQASQGRKWQAVDGTRKKTHLLRCLDLINTHVEGTPSHSNEWKPSMRSCTGHTTATQRTLPSRATWQSACHRCWHQRQTPWRLWQRLRLQRPTSRSQHRQHRPAGESKARIELHHQPRGLHQLEAVALAHHLKRAPPPQCHHCLWQLTKPCLKPSPRLTPLLGCSAWARGYSRCVRVDVCALGCAFFF